MAIGDPQEKNAEGISRLSRKLATQPGCHDSDSVSMERFAQLILMLPPQYQQVIKMRYLEEMTFESIAKVSNRSGAQVRSTWFRGIELLSALMHDHDR